MTNNQALTNNLTELFDELDAMEGEAKTRRGKPYKVWVMVCDAEDGEMRVVPRAQVRQYTKNTTYVGKRKGIVQYVIANGANYCCYDSRSCYISVIR